MDKRTQDKETAQANRVGARQEAIPSPSGGGGYQDIYKFSELKKEVLETEKIDPRLAKLRRIGLNETLIKIAKEIGVDNFLKMWEILDSDDRLKRDASGIMLCMRSFASYKRMLRNEYIISTANISNIKNKKLICHKIKEAIGENIDYSNCHKIIERAKIYGNF